MNDDARVILDGVMANMKSKGLKTVTVGQIQAACREECYDVADPDLADLFQGSDNARAIISHLTGTGSNGSFEFGAWKFNSRPN